MLYVARCPVCKTRPCGVRLYKGQNRVTVLAVVLELSVHYCGLGDEPLVVGVTSSLNGQWIMAWPLVCNKSPPPNQQSDEHMALFRTLWFFGVRISLEANLAKLPSFGGYSL